MAVGLLPIGADVFGPRNHGRAGQFERQRAAHFGLRGEVRDDRIDIDLAPVGAPRLDKAFGRCPVHRLLAHAAPSSGDMPEAWHAAILMSTILTLEIQLSSAMASITVIHAAVPDLPTRSNAARSTLRSYSDARASTRCPSAVRRSNLERCCSADRLDVSRSRCSSRPSGRFRACLEMPSTSISAPIEMSGCRATT